MSAFVIRAVDAPDLPRLTEIYAHAVLNGTGTFEITPPDEAEMARRVAALTRPGYPYIVAEDGEGAILGYAYAGPFRARPAYRWSVENSIYIAPEARGQGAGRALLLRLVELCEAAGFRQMIAVIGDSDNASSIRLHERAGFRTIGIFGKAGFKFGRWLDAVFMQMRIGDGGDTPPDETTFPGTLV